MQTNASAISGGSQTENLDPHHFLKMVGGRPEINFHWKVIGKGSNTKRRLIGNPNEPMRILHELFEKYLRSEIKNMGRDAYGPRMLPSAKGCVKGSNPTINSLFHVEGQFFYITDLKNAYPSVNLEKLAMLVVYIEKYDDYQFEFSLRALAEGASFTKFIINDPLFSLIHKFLEVYCAGIRGKGLAVGGPLSPYLMNLYCEVYIDSFLRRLCEKYEIVYTRYVDDLVFSREKPIISDMRREIRQPIYDADFDVNHRKSKVLCRAMGTIFVTKVGLQDDGGNKRAKLVFPKYKRRRLHNLIKAYLREQTDWPEKVSGFVAEFIYYYKNVDRPTKTDRTTFGLCKDFDAEWAKWRKKDPRKKHHKK